MRFSVNPTEKFREVLAYLFDTQSERDGFLDRVKKLVQTVSGNMCPMTKTWALQMDDLELTLTKSGNLISLINISRISVSV